MLSRQLEASSRGLWIFVHISVGEGSAALGEGGIGELLGTLATHVTGGLRNLLAASVARPAGRCLGLAR